MESVLDIYKMPYNEEYPIVCMDESPKQLIKQTRIPIPASPGNIAKEDFEYERHGVVQIFMANEPLKGKRFVEVSETKTKKDWAHFIKDLSEKSGIEAALQVFKMKPRPDGAFITNDFVAAVFMRALKEKGLKIPEDIAIVGFNNDAICTLVEPSLTTINYPGIDVGEVAARNLVNHLKGISNIQNTNTIVIHSDLVVRNSSKRKPQKTKKK